MQSPEQSFPVVGGNICEASGRSQVMEQTLAAFGRLDALVNNAGIAPRVRADITEATEDTFDEVIAVNLKGRTFYPSSRSRTGSRILENPGCHPGTS